MRVRLFLALAALGCGAGCDDLVEVLDEGFIQDNESALRHCVGGEFVGHLPRSSDIHHCENSIYYIDTPHYMTFDNTGTANGNVEVVGLHGYLAGELGVSTSTRMTGKVGIVRRWLAVHKRMPTCDIHDSVCQDEYVVRSWNLVGKVFINATTSGNARVNLERTARGEGVPLRADVVVQGNTRRTQLVVGPVLLCEDAEHLDCSSRQDGDPGGGVLYVGPDGGLGEAMWQKWDGGAAGPPSIPLPPDWSFEESPDAGP